MTKHNKFDKIELVIFGKFKGGGVVIVSYRKRRRRHMRKGTLPILLLLLSALLVSCTAGNNSAWFRSLLGTDVAAYRAGSVTAILETDSNEAQELTEVMDWFLSGSVHLKEFQNSRQALRLYRDAILNTLMRRNYASYVGNPALCSAISQAYPHITASVLIPQSDFESAASHCLGLSSVSNSNGKSFSYLPRAACYIPPQQARALTVSMTVLGLEETENTYRLSFKLEDTEGQSACYNAMFVKRDGATPYLKTLKSS